MSIIEPGPLECAIVQVLICKRTGAAIRAVLTSDSYAVVSTRRTLCDVEEVGRPRPSITLEARNKPAIRNQKLGDEIASMLGAQQIRAGTFDNPQEPTP